MGYAGSSQEEVVRLSSSTGVEREKEKKEEVKWATHGRNLTSFLSSTGLLGTVSTVVTQSNL